MKHFTLLEVRRDPCSLMIGTITRLYNSEGYKSEFLRRVTEAVEEHFDSKLTQGHESIIEAFEFIYSGGTWEDIEINTEGDGEDDYKHTIRILETWIY